MTNTYGITVIVPQVYNSIIIKVILQTKNRSEMYKRKYMRMMHCSWFKKAMHMSTRSPNPPDTLGR